MKDKEKTKLSNVAIDEDTKHLIKTIQAKRFLEKGVDVNFGDIIKEAVRNLKD